MSSDVQQNLDALFGISSQRKAHGLDVSTFVSQLSTVQKRERAALESFDAAGLESFQPGGSQANTMTSLYNGIKDAAKSAGLESIISNPTELEGAQAAYNGVDHHVARNMFKAAAITAMYVKGDDQRGLATALSEVTRPALEGADDSHTFTKMPNLTGPAGTIGTALENYDNKPIQGFWTLNMGVAFTATRQNPFAETLFVSTAVVPTKGGIVQQITYPTIVHDREHDIVGGPQNFKERMLLDALRHPSILKNESTRLIPVVTQDTANLFVSESDVAVEKYENIHGKILDTNWLRFNGPQFNLLNIAKQFYTSGTVTPDISFAIDPAVVLERILVKVGDQLVQFPVFNTPTAKFQERQNGNDRGILLDFDTQSLAIDNKTVDIKGNKLKVAEKFGDGEVAYLSTGASGSINTTYGTTDLQSKLIRLNTIRTAEGEVLQTASGRGKEIADVLGAATLHAYKLNARLVNTNLAERGLLLETRTYKHRQVLPYKYPITKLGSTMDTDQDAAKILEALTLAVYVQNSNDAVTTLLNYAETVKSLAERDSQGILPPGEIDGIMGHLFRPTYVEITIDVLKSIDSISSGSRLADLQGLLNNTIASVLFPARQHSNIDAAYQAQSNDQDEKPAFIINTDKNIVNYLMVTGDNRTLGPDVEFILNATNNEDMDGKIIIVPTSKNRTENNPLNFGTFFVAPSLVSKQSQSRPNNTTSIEYRVTPVNLHVPNQPWMIVINLKNFQEALTSSTSTLSAGNGVHSNTGTTTTGNSQGQPLVVNPGTSTDTGATNNTNGTGGTANGGKNGG